ncbi:hypothetical protein [Thioclava sp. GXIMD2076]|uniref:Uncharacterized protein n=1 Tax=Thioclava kandeliae TaxID=3070818 RepID=A0ABV1SI73_9RHOB
MGYSPTKKQLDLKEFLSQPGKKNTGRKSFGYRSGPSKTKPVETDHPVDKKDD